MHFYGWENGLKTGMYYLRSRPAVDAIKFTVDVKTLMEVQKENKTKSENDLLKKRNKNGMMKACPLRPPNLNEDDDCLMCGS